MIGTVGLSPEEYGGVARVEDITSNWSSLRTVFEQHYGQWSLEQHGEHVAVAWQQRHGWQGWWGLHGA